MKKNKINFSFFFNFEEYPDPNFVYLAEYIGWGVLIVPQKGKSILLVPQMEKERAKLSPHKVVVVKKRLSEELKNHVKEKKTYGIDEHSITLDIFKGIKKGLKGKYIDIGKDIREIRSIKTKKEINYLSKACSISDIILKKCFDNFKIFKTERDVEIFLKTETIKSGCELAFPPIVASGKGASQPHYEPQNIKLQKGFCVIDFGVKFNGYHSDTTRMVYLGKPQQQEIKLYNSLLKAQENTIKSITKKATCGRIFETCMIELGNLKEEMCHGLGHGVGVEIHELPNLKSDSKDIIKNNQVFTIEPGIYQEEKYGLRIEDTILMKNRPVILTKISKKLKIIS